MVLIKRGLDTKSKVCVLDGADISVDEDKAKQALADAKLTTNKDSSQGTKGTTTQSTEK